jgi:hypothetical protein
LISYRSDKGEQFVMSRHRDLAAYFGNRRLEFH